MDGVGCTLGGVCGDCAGDGVRLRSSGPKNIRALMEVPHALGGCLPQLGVCLGLGDLVEDILQVTKCLEGQGL